MLRVGHCRERHRVVLFVMANRLLDQFSHREYSNGVCCAAIQFSSVSSAHASYASIHDIVQAVCRTQSEEGSGLGMNQRLLCIFWRYRVTKQRRELRCLRVNLRFTAGKNGRLHFLEYGFDFRCPFPLSSPEFHRVLAPSLRTTCCTAGITQLRREQTVQHGPTGKCVRPRWLARGLIQTIFFQYFLSKSPENSGSLVHVCIDLIDLRFLRSSAGRPGCGDSVDPVPTQAERLAMAIPESVQPVYETGARSVSRASRIVVLGLIEGINPPTRCIRSGIEENAESGRVAQESWERLFSVGLFIPCEFVQSRHCQIAQVSRVPAYYHFDLQRRYVDYLSNRSVGSQSRSKVSAAWRLPHLQIRRHNLFPEEIGVGLYLPYWFDCSRQPPDRYVAVHQVSEKTPSRHRFHGSRDIQRYFGHFHEGGAYLKRYGNSKVRLSVDVVGGHIRGLFVLCLALELQFSIRVGSVPSPKRSGRDRYHESARPHFSCVFALVCGQQRFVRLSPISRSPNLVQLIESL